MVGRRVFIRATVGAFGAVGGDWKWPFLQSIDLNSQKIEEQSGDPDLPREMLRYDSKKVDEALIRTEKLLGIRKNPERFASQMLRVAVNYRGITRDKNPEKIEQFLSLFPIEPRDDSSKLLPFCAAGVSFCACQAYCDLSPVRISYDEDAVGTFKGVLPDIDEFYFKPHCSCQEIVNDARKRNLWARKNVKPAPGWLVFYDWKQHGVASHVGIIESSSPRQIDTVEFNTKESEFGDQSNGGAVARRSRTYDFIMGFVRTYQT